MDGESSVNGEEQENQTVKTKKPPPRGELNFTGFCVYHHINHDWQSTAIKDYEQVQLGNFSLEFAMGAV